MVLETAAFGWGTIWLFYRWLYSQLFHAFPVDIHCWPRYCVQFDNATSISTCWFTIKMYTSSQPWRFEKFIFNQVLVTLNCSIMWGWTMQTILSSLQQFATLQIFQLEIATWSMRWRRICLVFHWAWTFRISLSWNFKYVLNSWEEDGHTHVFEIVSCKSTATDKVDNWSIFQAFILWLEAWLVIRESLEYR